MTVNIVQELLSAQILCCENNIHLKLECACGSDMMSDVLAFIKKPSVLLTGLCNLQVVRTAEMMDIVCICFVRGKLPSKDMINLAKEKGIVLLSTNLRMFPACGILYANGLHGGGIVE